jgi:hypothetical protein
MLAGGINDAQLWHKHWNYDGNRNRCKPSKVQNYVGEGDLQSCKAKNLSHAVMRNQNKIYSCLFYNVRIPIAAGVCIHFTAFYFQ